MNAPLAGASWPLWRRRQHATTDDLLDEYQALARYATVDALRGFDAPERLLPAPSDAASWVYQEVFMRGRWTYVEEPKRPAPLASHATQQIRAPRDIQRYEAATCLDASLLFVALAVRAGARAHVVLGQRHALVILGDQPSTTKARRLGIAYADETTVVGLASGAVVALDVVQALTTMDRPEPAAFEVAVAEGSRFVTHAVESASRLALIDVERVNLDRRLEPHAPDPDLTFIPRSLPPHAGALELYASQERMCERLRDENGVIVIHGDSGTGKTTAALHLAAERDAGPSLMLDASSGETVVASAADIYAPERGTSVERLESLDRDGDAAALLARLRSAPGPWCVVFDNADGDPSKVLPRLPRPDPDKGQALIVTTTNVSWFKLGLVRVVETLSPIDDEDVERALGAHRALAPLVAGRAVTLRAFLRYLREGDAASLQRQAVGVPDDELRGPEALVRASLEGEDELRPVLRRLTLLPPDHLPIGEDVADLDTFQRLEALGLVDVTPAAGVARMHRLVGRAAERVLGSADEAQAAAGLVSRKGSFDALSAAADPELLGRYTKLLLASIAQAKPMSVADGHVLQRAASLMEQRGRVQESRDLAEPAVEALGAVEGDEPIELADALQSLARWANQHPDRDPDALANALAQMAWAQRVAARYGDERRAARSRRLEALLRLKVAGINEDREAGTREIVAALEDLEREADLATRRDSGVDRAEALRARFNVAGPRISLAQRFPFQADEYLSEAQRVYEQVGAARRLLYPQTQHPHVAACISGAALARYMRANLLEVNYDDRQRLLREATDLEQEALTDRFELEGPLGGADTSKSSRLLTKIAYARHRLNDSAVASPVLDEARNEIGVPRLTGATKDLHAYAVRWLGSPPLAAVLGLFDAPAPDALESVASDRAIYDDLETRSILSAARALGLMDTALPERRVFDKILVFGDGVAFAEGLVSRGAVAGEVVPEVEPESGASVLLVTPHLHRVRWLALTNRRLAGQPVDAVGFEPKPGRVTFGPSDYLRELALTAGILRSCTPRAS